MTAAHQMLCEAWRGGVCTCDRPKEPPPLRKGEAGAVIREIHERLTEPKPFGVSAYPLVPGHKARATSRSAAAAIAPRQKRLQERCLWALTGGPKTADETAAQLGESVLSVRPRFTELSFDSDEHPALIEDSGLRRKNRSGRNACVWQLRGAL